jgi:hypothetical protein
VRNRGPATASIRPGAIAAAAFTIAVGDNSIEFVWCSPKPKKPNPTSSARRTAWSTSRIACAVGR